MKANALPIALQGGRDRQGRSGPGADRQSLAVGGWFVAAAGESILKEPEWAERLTDADKRGLSPLFWSHANLYGTIEIDMDRHLDLGLAA